MIHVASLVLSFKQRCFQFACLSHEFSKSLLFSTVCQNHSVSSTLRVGNIIYSITLATRLTTLQYWAFGQFHRASHSVGTPRDT
jgi:hypothetical protein